MALGRPGLGELAAVEVLMGESVLFLTFLASEIGVPLLVLLADYGVMLQLAVYVDLMSKCKNFKLYDPFMIPFIWKLTLNFSGFKLAVCDSQFVAHFGD